MSDQPAMAEIQVDKTNLYREETFSDLKVASIRRLTPVREDGSDDSGRETIFIGETTLMSQRGPLPVQAPIEAKSLEEAFEKFPEAVNAAVEQLIEQAREMQRQEASRIVVPGQAPAGGSRPLLGTNPLAFGWPRPNGQPPFIFDFATSAIARGDIELHHRENKPIPEGWGIDRLGQHSQNPADVLDGALLTFGGHKGSALSIMIELIAGPLIGDLTSAESLAYDDGAGASPYHGELILAMDPERFLGSSIEDYMARAENLFSSIIAQGARLPSQRRYTARQRTQKEGISIPESLYQELSRLARL